ncbi:hypothetical protein [Stenotrophomonas phage vB_SmaS_BUCT548]|uniref:Uncharacterized protein n=1 Tax=Stenotrophomonas phage vB_SmaS_BUCT548 TaxID=2712941 RepID=A0A7D2LHY0_9CAUD|nr:hypothetical protein PQD75_gp072 [Stenotrophomonas phage vB_SmaS_BUCT548]QIQ60800.1 hypothetical protein [Stenotrophomonas phage vB_SmaS_BUCT548]
MKITRNYKPESPVIDRLRLEEGMSYLMVQSADGVMFRKEKQLLVWIARDKHGPIFVNLSSGYVMPIAEVGASCRFVKVETELNVKED